MAARADRPRVVALAGPTASGKSAAALILATSIDAEIISVDSALVYRGMDIGTAKPSPEERAAVTHHLIDIRDPKDAYSAAEFVSDASAIVERLLGEGRSVVLAGGTMLYFKALFDGLSAMPPADAVVRAAIDAEASERGWPAMHAALAEVDAQTAARLAPNDSQRIQRALEVFRSTGRPISSFHADKDKSRALRPDLFLSLEPGTRAWLHERIEQRFDQMLGAGFVDEVRTLRARGDLSPDLPSMRSVGYRQAWEQLDISEATGRALDVAELGQRGIFATRQLAKRQLTWLRSMPHRTVVACDSPHATSEMLAHLEQLE